MTKRAVAAHLVAVSRWVCLDFPCAHLVVPHGWWCRRRLVVKVLRVRERELGVVWNAVGAFATGGQRGQLLNVRSYNCVTIRGVAEHVNTPHAHERFAQRVNGKEDVKETMAQHAVDTLAHRYTCTGPTLN